MEFKNIVSDPAVLSGKPCIRGTRISIDVLLEWFASGASMDEIIQTYPQLTKEALSEALLYASRFLKNEVVIEVSRVA